MQLGGLLFGVLGVTAGVLDAAVVAIVGGIVPHFADWLTLGRVPLFPTDAWELLVCFQLWRALCDQTAGIYRMNK